MQTSHQENHSQGNDETRCKYAAITYCAHCDCIQRAEFKQSAHECSEVIRRQTCDVISNTSFDGQSSRRRVAPSPLMTHRHGDPRRCARCRGVLLNRFEASGSDPANKAQPWRIASPATSRFASPSRFACGSCGELEGYRHQSWCHLYSINEASGVESRHACNTGDASAKCDSSLKGAERRSNLSLAGLASGLASSLECTNGPTRGLASNTRRHDSPLVANRCLPIIPAAALGGASTPDALPFFSPRKLRSACTAPSTQRTSIEFVPTINVAPRRKGLRVEHCEADASGSAIRVAIRGRNADSLEGQQSGSTPDAAPSTRAAAGLGWQRMFTGNGVVDLIQSSPLSIRPRRATGLSGGWARPYSPLELSSPLSESRALPVPESQSAVTPVGISGSARGLGRAA